MLRTDLKEGFSYTCKRKDLTSAYTGNYISGDKFLARLRIEKIITKNCQPESSYPDCSCSKLFDGLLSNQDFQDLELIQFRHKMSAQKDNYLAACRCYLGASARAGFNSVEIKFAKDTGCNKYWPISTETYDNVCKDDFAPKECGGYWNIIKM